MFVQFGCVPVNYILTEVRGFFRAKIDPARGTVLWCHVALDINKIINQTDLCSLDLIENFQL